jgi:hypothetical protein
MLFKEMIAVYCENRMKIAECKLTVAQLANKFPHFMDLENLLQHSVPPAIFSGAKPYVTSHGDLT